MRAYSSKPIERTIIGGFLSLILTGGLLLWISNFLSGRPISFTDALFSATSAVCVTGLASIDIGSELTLISQGILLLLIQLGGLGVMTVTTALLVVAGRYVGHRQRLLFASGLGLDGPAGVIKLLKSVIATVFFIEGLATIPLFLVFNKDFSTSQALWLALFHSVSAFCNAGFSPLLENIGAYNQSGIVLITVMTLIVIGGLGFSVIREVLHHLQSCLKRERQRIPLSLYSRIVLWSTGILIVIGGFLFAAVEWNGAFVHLSPVDRCLNAFFLSVSARTAGFNNLNMVTLSSLSIVVLDLLMIIGASPGSTGGGMKTTSVSVLIMAAWNTARGKDDLVIAGRNISNSTIIRGLSLFMLYILSLLIGLFILILLEGIDVQSGFFEVISAMGTVGFSLNLTPELSPWGKYVLMILMFWGRVGIVTFVYGLLKNQDDRECIHYPEVSIPIG